MSKQFGFKVLVSLWLGAFGLVAALLAPMTLATAVLILMVGLIAPAVMILLWKDQPPTVAEVLNRVERVSEDARP